MFYGLPGIIFLRVLGTLPHSICDSGAYGQSTHTSSEDCQPDPFHIGSAPQLVVDPFRPANSQNSPSHLLTNTLVLWRMLNSMFRCRMKVQTRQHIVYFIQPHQLGLNDLLSIMNKTDQLCPLALVSNVTSDTGCQRSPSLRVGSCAGVARQYL